ncbi:polyprenol monophosphomannose synthase [Flavobacteriaceae bacterium]|nr:polyprenol monophosphomannose synthase [Flavobacteriaceae bacterium]MDB4107977.1 polyprenol monophosphomannose synthase [Flavobacteriaceae bacterium]MDB4182929.1 polyprenol monophosphomannose synthase [Flavobacteriaceae bacterium]MDB4206406.1 polyprenol monophosphomannose synthase [Flavobacteriaceae bacterium]
MKDSVVIIPTYNEIENIEAIINAVFSQNTQVHILIVDDHSPDQTAQKVEVLQKKYVNRLFLHKRSGKLGLGTAYIEGFKWSLEHDYEFIFEMDADFSHNPKDLIRLYEACKYQNADLSIGSRYIKGVNVVNWPLSRVLLSYGASLYVRIITGMKILDPTAGFVCYRRSVLEALDLEAIKFIGYAFQIEMKYNVYKKNFNIQEIPITFTDRRYGVSKLSKGIISEAVFGVVQMRLKTILGTS